MHTCTKRFNDIPAGHRQPNHDGHCAWIHGHDWAVEITFMATALDDCGFVVDFGRLDYIREWFEINMDHCLLLNKDDPHLQRFSEMLGDLGIHNITVVDDCSAEGLAKYLCETFNPMVQSKTARRVWIYSVRVHEDGKNSATFINRAELGVA